MRLHSNGDKMFSMHEHQSNTLKLVCALLGFLGGQIYNLLHVMEANLFTSYLITAGGAIVSYLSTKFIGVLWKHKIEPWMKKRFKIKTSKDE